MEAIDLMKRIDEAVFAMAKLDPPLYLAIAYQDTVTRRWASEICGRVKKLIGEEKVFSTWWEFNHTTGPGLPPGSIQAASLADLIIISVQAAENLPHDLLLWNDSWRQRRTKQQGALLALIGERDGTADEGDRTQQYLTTVAANARIEFFPLRRNLPVETLTDNVDQMTERAQTMTCVLRGIMDTKYDVVHWGINE
jgi:hypothetical protein